MAGKKTPRKYIHTLNVNGLKGRVLHLPAPKKRANRVLLIYGFGSKIERVRPLADFLNGQAEVLLPDLPGFGGMSSLHTIGITPSVDAQADYIATLVKLRFGKEPFCVAGLDYGFLVTDRLLRKYPDIARQVTTVACFAGFSGGDELQYNRYKLAMNRMLASILVLPLPAGLAHGAAIAFRPRLTQVSTDLRTYLQARRDVLLSKRPERKLRHTVHYFPGCDGIAVDQTRVLANLKRMYKHVEVETNFELRCSKESIALQPLGRQKRLQWL